MESSEDYGLLLSDDMIFSSRITGTALGLGLKMTVVKSGDDLLKRAREKSPTGVILDLAYPGLQVAELIGRLKETCSPMPRLVAYGSHVDADGLRAAREAGCDIVLPRSRFVTELPQSLPEWLTPSS